MLTEMKWFINLLIKLMILEILKQYVLMVMILETILFLSFFEKNKTAGS